MSDRRGTELTPKIDLSTNTNTRYSSPKMNSTTTNNNNNNTTPSQQQDNSSSSSNNNYSSIPLDPETGNNTNTGGGKNQAQPLESTSGGPGFKQGPGIQIGSAIIWSPGKHGTYMSFLLLLAGMIASIVAMSYAPSITSDKFTSDCPTGYESACQRTGVVLRFSFALVIIVSLFYY